MDSADYFIAPCVRRNFLKKDHIFTRRSALILYFLVSLSSARKGIRYYRVN